MAGKGSLPGERKGGRQKGVPNKVTLTKAAEIAAGGLTPLDYMLQVLRDENRSDAERMDAAKAAAPYAHPKLATMMVKGDKDAPLRTVVDLSDEALAAIATGNA